jgi:hypothetical protein
MPVRPAGIFLEQQDIGRPTAASDAYRNCFAGVQETADACLVPH